MIAPMIFNDGPPSRYRLRDTPVLRRSLLLIIVLLAAVGGGAISMLALPALWRMSWPYVLLFATLGMAQLGTAVASRTRPVRRRVLRAAATALAVVAL
jgi:hypothetical protein